MPISIRQLPKTTTSQQPTVNSGLPTADTTASDTLSQQPKGIQYHTDLPDSVLTGSIFGFHRPHYEVKIMEVFHPNFDPTGAHSQTFKHSSTQTFNYFLSAGEMGHPHYDVYQDFTDNLSLNYRPDLFPNWSKSPENLTFYQVQQPYTLLSYNSSLDKDYQVHVTHTQNITERWNFALDYHLLSPRGVYANDYATDHILDINTNYYSRDGRYQLLGGFIWQKYSLGENGGLSDETPFILQSISNPSGLPVVSTNGSSQYAHTTLFVNQLFNTVRQVPWYRQKPIAKSQKPTPDTANSPDTTQNSKLKTQNSYDTLFPSQPRIVNTGVFGLDLQFDRHNYRALSVPTADLTAGMISDSMHNNMLTGSLYWTNDAYLDHHWRNPLKLTLGVRTYLSKLHLDTARFDTTQITTLLAYPFASVVVAPWHRSELSILAETGLSDGEYNLDGNLSIDLSADSSQSHSQLLFRASSSQFTDDEIIGALPYQRTFLSSTLPTTAYYEASHPFINANRIEAAYHYEHKSLNNTPVEVRQFQISLAATTLTHYHYLSKDPLSSAIVTCYDHADKTIPLLQGKLNMEIRLWQWLHYDMLQLFQYDKLGLVHVPLWASKNSIYADFHLFHRALRTQVGIDIRYHTAFKADAYDPSLGLFYHQDEVSVGNYLYADFFINLQVKRASIYLKAGHINSFLENEAHYFSIPHYPEKPFALFYGLTWQFFD